MSKSKKNRRVLASLLAAALCFQTVSGDAGWMDDWYQSKTSSGPSYFEGQARGYVSGGSFSARWPSHTDYPISVSPPRLSIGCGGIDAFMGNISFLKPDMMVKKLQNILTNSAFIAFDMALDTLCPKCSALMKAAEDISNKLNAMSINDCNAAKGVMSGLRPLQESVTASLWEDNSKKSISQGLTDSMDEYSKKLPSMPTSNDMRSWWNSQTGNPPTAITETSGCQGILAELFPSDSSYYPVSAMDSIGEWMGFPREHVQMMEGLVGDILINQDHSVDYLGACPGNTDLSLNKFMNGDYEAMDDAGNCVAASSSQINLIQNVSNSLLAIANKLQSAQALSDQDLAFLNSIPLNMIYVLRDAVKNNGTNQMVAGMSEIIATYWMQNALMDLLSRSQAIVKQMNRAGNGMANGSDNCNLKVAGGTFPERQKEFQERVDKVMQLLKTEMAISSQQFLTTAGIAQQIEKIQDQMSKDVTQRFGPSVAARAMRYL